MIFSNTLIPPSPPRFINITFLIIVIYVQNHPLVEFLYFLFHTLVVFLLHFLYRTRKIFTIGTYRMAKQELAPITLPPFVTKNRDALLPLGMIGILIVMVIPVPSFLMDMLIACSITLGILILLVAMYSLKPLDFSIFPSILLIVTLFRLSLNIATTRLILLHGHEGGTAAGTIIESFGQFVVGGNYVVGGVVFLILVIINFVVITKGATRIAEVSARFTLDAMPGKQMSIDADLNAGLITEDNARERRKQVEHEADFYGAMDGASKFVRGDAIAGIIITIINIIGGLVIGILQHQMTPAAAAQNFSLLTIGDGLVSQIPALLVSTAAGIVVTRAATESSMGEVVQSQLFFQPRAAAIASVILAFFALMPGLPTVPFLFFAGCMGSLAYFGGKQKEYERQQQIKLLEEETREEVKEPEQIEQILPADPLSLEVGYGLITLVDKEQNGDLLERIKAIRRQFALDMGFIVPPVHIRDNLELKPSEYAIMIKGCDVARGEIMANHFLAMGGEDIEGSVEGIETKEPAFGLPALWILEKDREQAQALGFTVVDSSTIIATHLTEILKQHSHELMGRQETQNLIDAFTQKYPKIIEGIVPDLVSLGVIQKVLQNLLKERVSIRDLQTIIEVIADHAPTTKSTDILTELVRQACARSITRQYVNDDGKLYALMLDQDVEETLAQAIKPMENGSILALEPNTAQRILNALTNAMEKFATLNTFPVVICMPNVRSHLRRLIERFLPQLVVMSHTEVAVNVPVESVGLVRLTDAY